MIRVALLATLLAVLPKPYQPISLGQVQTEYGGANPISITEYRGYNTWLPASGAISLFDFYSIYATISPATVSASCGAVAGGGTCVAISVTVTATANHGVGPFTYSWSVSGGGSAASPTSQSTTLRRSGTIPMADDTCTSTTGTATVTITDSRGWQGTLTFPFNTGYCNYAL